MSEDQPRDTTRHGAIAWMARNSIAAHLIMIILLVGGIWTALTMQKEVDPNFQLDVVGAVTGAFQIVEGFGGVL